MKISNYKFEISETDAYTYTIPLGILREKIEQHIKEDDLLLCPDFQRGRVWTHQQQIDFCEFILKGGKCNPILFNHPGWMRTFEGSMVCVDGLQRITALLAMLNDEVLVFGHKLSAYEDVIPQLRRLYVDFKIHQLQTKTQVLTWYLQVNTTGTPHTKEEIDRVVELKKLCE